jgi:hypothetical protein
LVRLLLYPIISIHVLYCLHCLASNTTNQNALAGQAFLNAEFRSHKDAPPNFPPATICSAIDSFKQSLVSRSHRSVCSACGILYESANIKQLLDNEKCPISDRMWCRVILERLKTAGLDKCGYTYENGYWLFCPKCYTKTLQGKIPKFSALNYMNVVMCQDYPSALEECVIARRHRILKLRPPEIIEIHRTTMHYVDI